MRITYLGTGACMGFPAVFCSCNACQKARNDNDFQKENRHSRAQILINDDLLIDFPPETYAHSLYFGLDFSKIKYVFVTHPHGDHFYPGEMGSRIKPFFYETTDMTLYTGQDGIVWMNNDLRISSDDIQQKYRFNMIAPQYYERYDVGNYTIIPTPANHGTLTPYLYFITDNINGKTLFQYCDSGRLNDDEILKLSKLDVKADVVNFDCTMGDEDCLAAWGERDAVHMGIPDFVVMRDKFIKAGICDEKTKYYGTHLSHFCQNVGYRDLKPAADKAHVNIAYDGLIVEL